MKKLSDIDIQDYKRALRAKVEAAGRKMPRGAKYRTLVAGLLSIDDLELKDRPKKAS